MRGQSLRRTTSRGGLLFDLEYVIHDRIWQIGFCGRAQAGEIWFCGHPAGLQTGERRCRDCSRGLKVDTSFLGAFGEAPLSLIEGGGDAAVAFGVGDVAPERIGAEDEVGGSEEFAGIWHPADER